MGPERLYFVGMNPAPNILAAAVVDRLVVRKGGIRPVLVCVFYSARLDMLLYKITKPAAAVSGTGLAATWLVFLS